MPFVRLGRNLNALPGDVVLPAVVRAAQSRFLVPAEPQRHAAVRAELVHQAIPALGVTEGDQPLRQQLDAHRRAVVLRKLLREEGGHPVLPEQGAHRRPRPGLGKQLVDLLLQHDCPVFSSSGPGGYAAVRAARRRRSHTSIEPGLRHRDSFTGIGLTVIPLLADSRRATSPRDWPIVSLGLSPGPDQRRGDAVGHGQVPRSVFGFAIQAAAGRRSLEWPGNRGAIGSSAATALFTAVAASPNPTAISRTLPG